MSIISVQDLAKSFGKIEAVKGVSFEVEVGEIFGFLGPNGAGKTTTINMLCTLLKPGGGGATVNGHDIVREKNDVRRSIGLVFQDTTLDDYLTAEQNIMFHALAYGVPKKVRQERTKALLTLMGLWDRRKGHIRTYSGGMKRRLEIARGLIHLPRVLFLDEPTLGLDPQTRNRIWEYIRDLRREEDLTIFLTTHYMDEAENCDRIAVIDHGEIVALDTPDNLKSQVGGDLLTLRTDDISHAEHGAARQALPRTGDSRRRDHGARPQRRVVSAPVRTELRGQHSVHRPEEAHLGRRVHSPDRTRNPRRGDRRSGADDAHDAYEVSLARIPLPLKLRNKRPDFNSGQLREQGGHSHATQRKSSTSLR